MAKFYESFHHNVGALNHTWGKHGIKTGDGHITLHTDSGVMQKPWGKHAGFGYGYYEVTAKMSADVQGPAVVLWPGDDKWPGREIDIVEVINGKPYGTVHWRTHDGKDAYKTVTFHGVDETKVHKYGVEWTPEKIEWFVDGKSQGAIYGRSGKDAKHGGVDATISVMNRDWEGGWLTVYDVKYNASGDGELWDRHGALRLPVSDSAAAQRQ